jgi:LysM repeat protein
MLYNRVEMRKSGKYYNHRKTIVYAVGICSIALLVIGWLLPVRVQADQPAPQNQVPVYTPTPQPDGRIIYIVQPNDTLLRISLISGVSLDELRGMNNLVNDIIITGQELLLGLGGPAEVKFTPGPTPTATVSYPTPTPEPGTGNLCILLFNDTNGDSLRQEDEPSIPGGAISVSNRSGSVSETVDTGTGFEAHCFEYLLEDEYTISVAVPAGYNATTNSSYILVLGAGEEAYVDFGAQPNSETLAEAPILPAEGQKSPLLGIIGGVILLLGLGIAIFAGRLMRGR